MTIKGFKKLKIYRKFRARRWDNTTVPEIRLEGKWLDQLGFKEGEEVTVKLYRKKLVITPSKGSEQK